MRIRDFGSLTDSFWSGLARWTKTQWQPTQTVHDPNPPLTLDHPPSADGEAASAIAVWVVPNADANATIARVTQAPVEVVLTEPSPTTYVTQGPVEVVIASTGDEQRVSQVLVETVQGQSATVRTSQVVSEVLIAQPEFTRLSQLLVEVLQPGIVESRVSQMVGEVLDAGQRAVRVSQVVVELLGKTSTYCGPPSLSPAALCGKPDVLAWLEWTVPMREN